MNIQYTSNNKNIAANLIFEELYNVSKLSGSGEYVSGGLTREKIKLILYSHFFDYKINGNETWGDLIQKNIDDTESVENFLINLLKEIEKIKIIEEVNSLFSSYEYDYKFTTDGFKLYLKALKSDKQVELFSDSDLVPSKNAPSYKTIIISEEKKEQMTKDILEIIHIYKKNYNTKISFSELFIRYMSNIYPDFRKYKSISEVKKSSEYNINELNNIEKMIESEIFSCFRKDLVYYENYYQLIDITSAGVKYLQGDECAIEDEDKLNSLSKKVSIIHISDLHFGSYLYDGVENKDGIKGADALKISMFNNFSKMLNDSSSNENYLIISGDLTTKNEEEGFDDCLKALKKLKIKQDNIYIVPGNHDCDREQKTERSQFSKFISYFSEYNNPFVKNKYIIDKELKLFIMGFNSIHISSDDDKQELFYIEENKMEELDHTIEKLANEIDDFNRYTKIAVIHNNIVPHPSIELKKYPDILNLFRFKYRLIQLGFKFIFSGHKHQALLERHTTYADEIEGDLLIVSAASLCGQVMGERNGFQIIDIYKDMATENPTKVVIKEYETNQMGEYKEKKLREITY